MDPGSRSDFEVVLLDSDGFHVYAMIRSESSSSSSSSPPGPRVSRIYVMCCFRTSEISITIMIIVVLPPRGEGLLNK